MGIAFNPYDVVGVKSGASLDEIKAAFRSRALTLHPDKGGDPEKFKRLQEAYEILKRDFNPDGTRRGVTTSANTNAYTSGAPSPGRSPLEDFEEFFKTVFGGVGRHGVSRPTQAETVDEYFARVEAARAKTNGEPTKPKEPVQPPRGATFHRVYVDEPTEVPSSNIPPSNAKASNTATDDWQKKYEEGRREAKETRDRERAQRESKEQADRAKRLKRAQEQAERYRRRTMISNIEDALRWLADFNAQVTFTERGHVQVQIWVDRPRPCVVEMHDGPDFRSTDPVTREIFYAFDRTMVDARGPNLLEATRAAALDAMRYTAL
jgi:curved DNA-binding protein CbpA